VLTDGLTEVFDSNGKEFGLERIKDVLAATHDRPLPEIEDAILSAVRGFGPQEDDQTLLLIRVT
jgi:sigma-B regulation protein RsbU (phosphoserine phosphatase)